MTEEIVKADIAVPEGFSDIAESVSTELCKPAHQSKFVECGVRASDILLQMGTTLVRLLEGKPLVVPPSFESDPCLDINSSGRITMKNLRLCPHNLASYGGSYRIRVYPSKSIIKITYDLLPGLRSLFPSISRMAPERAFGKLEHLLSTADSNNEKQTIFQFFNEYTSLPYIFHNWMQNVRQEQTQKNKYALIALKNVAVLEKAFNVYDPLEEKFRLLEAGGAK